MIQTKRGNVRLQWSKLCSLGTFPDATLQTLADLTNAYLSEPKNRRKRKPGEDVARAFKHLRTTCSAVEAQPDLNLGKQIGKFPAFIRHASSFEAVGCRITGLRSEFLRRSQRRRNRVLRALARTEPVGDQCILREVNTVEELQSIGRQLALCVSNRATARDYIRRVRNGEIELWLVVVRDERYALIEIKTETRAVECCETRDGGIPRFDNPQAILEALKADGDDDDAFFRDGAFRLFRSTSSPEPVTHELDDGRQLQLWVTDQEIIACQAAPEAATARIRGRRRCGRLPLRRRPRPGNTRRGRAWSRFCLEDGSWQGSFFNTLSLGTLFECARKYPAIARQLGWGG